MIKRAFVFGMLLCSLCAFAQGDIKVLLEQLLTKARGYNDIKSVIDILKKQNAVYQYVPSLNPVNPKKMKRISSQAGVRYHPIDKVFKKHEGIDISANLATPIHAPASGTVVIASSGVTGYGNYINIKHKYGYETRYGHLSKIYVKAGDVVKKGDIIGFIGSTGKSTGNHLHFEIRKFGCSINPEPFLQL